MTKTTRTYCVLAAVSLVVGLAIFQWGSGWIRNYGGDAVAVVSLYFVLSLFVHVSSWKRAAAVFVFALAIECLQVFIGPSEHRLVELGVGSVFDLYDILVYGVALTIVAALDAKITRE